MFLRYSTSSCVSIVVSQLSIWLNFEIIDSKRFTKSYVIKSLLLSLSNLYFSSTFSNFALRSDIISL